jgi:signal-transduction protein with cAMP-binding, CBS, and nucleotidyltransferase domain
LRFGKCLKTRIAVLPFRLPINWELGTSQCSPENTIEPQADAMKAISIMNRTGNSRLMVVEGGHLVGIIALKDLLELLSLKVELED